MRNEDQNFYYKREWSRAHERAGTFALALEGLDDSRSGHLVMPNRVG